MLSQVRFAGLLGAVNLVFATTASAHVSMASPGFAGQTQVLNFSIGHGCEGADTFRLEVTIPKEVTSVRALPSVFGDVEVKTDDAGVALAVIWSKATVRPKDDQYYQMAIRAKLPDAPFTTLYFTAKQSCRTADGKESVVDWAATAEEVAAATAKMDTAPEPAPALTIVPVRATGWNKYTAKTKITDLSIFNDAQIVWVGDAAYSNNPTTKELIKAESGVTELTEIKADAEIWVRY